MRWRAEWSTEHTDYYYWHVPAIYLQRAPSVRLLR